MAHSLDNTMNQPDCQNAGEVLVAPVLTLPAHSVAMECKQRDPGSIEETSVSVPGGAGKECATRAGL